VNLSQGTTLDAPLHELILAQQECVPEPVTLRDAERAHIERNLREANGVIGAAAVRLGLPRSALFYKMRRLGIGARPRKQQSKGAAAWSYEQDWDMTQPSQPNPVPAIRILGRMGSPPGYMIRDFLYSSEVPFEWVELVDDEDARTRAGVSGLRDSRLPVCLFPDGTRLE
jgi:hypothetical protein